MLRYFRPAIGFLVLTATFGAGCVNPVSPPGAQSLVATKGPPTQLQYATSPANYPQTIEITPNTLSAQGQIDRLTIRPATLPDGLAFDSATGTISGTPTQITPATEYIVTAYNGYGSNFTRLVIAITDIPPVMSYAGDTTVVYNIGVPIAPITPTLTGGPATDCLAYPPLPAGLTVSPACEISGTPTESETAANHFVFAVNSGGSSSILFNITVIDNPPTVSYPGSPFTFYRGIALTTVNPTAGGGEITSCAAAPSLPTGLTLGADCSISGTPNNLLAATPHTITATNNGGSANAGISITIQDLVPDISFSGTPFTFTKGTPIAALTPTNAGGIINSCTPTPALPAGLELSANCQITGTPTAVAAATNHAIKATNGAGNSTATINIKVNDIPPKFRYASNAFIFLNKSAITPKPVTSTGGAITGCSATPALPAGLSLSNDCTLSGTPTQSAPATTHLITGTNSGGSGTTTISITVQEIPPVLSFAGSPFTFNKNVPITAKTPANSGGTVTACSSAPPLPAGLVLSSTCIISGTPSVTSAVTAYAITGTNSVGSSAPNISITVNDTPPNISYTGSPFIFTLNSPITTLSATNTGGAPTSCSIAPALPAGLTISNTDCSISGTPTALSTAADYIVTASNTGGSSTATINITVKDSAPEISYAGNPYNFFKNSAITALSPANTGGAIVSCAINPAVPAGLTFSATDCALTGTPTSVTASTSYTVTATNTGGSSGTVLVFEVKDVTPTLSYSPASYTLTKGGAVSITATTGGGTITSCSSSPGLPAGFVLSNTTCDVSGTANAVSAAASYTITATNSGGSVSSILNITVNDLLPNISFAGSPFEYTLNAAIAALTPTNTGGTVVSCESNPTLPAGLTLSNTCVVTGTPTVLATAADYTIIATNSAGSDSKSINITVKDIAPTISYVGSPFTYTKGSAIPTLTPTTGGGAIVSCASSPALPAGLSLSSGCVLNGTPSSIAAAADYTITATNSGGSNSATVNITVKDVAPNISYAGSPFTHTKDVAIASLTPVNSGGAIVSCNSVPALPAGLSLSAGCVLSGTPTAITGAADYVVTATNTGGTSAATINIAVNDAKPIISYSGSPFAYIINDAIAALNVANSGGTITSCASVPALPAGLAISATCAITGTPTALTPAQTYTVTASNTGGSSSVGISIAVVDDAPVIDYLPTSYNFTYTKGTAIDALTPNNSGGPITSCSASPALPAGLSLSSTCTLSGTPSAIRAAQDYTIQATNSGGSSSSVLTITVNDTAPVIAYPGSPFVYTLNAAIATVTPTNTGGAILSCASIPALPAGLNLSATCVITGTPTALSGQADYTITATNSGGNSSATIRITVNATAPAISYAGSPFVHVKNSAIAVLNPTNTGGAIVSCASNPALPAGLNLSSTCVLTGTPVTVAAAADYTITATNSGGSSSATINIKVNDLASNLSYAGSPFTYTRNAAISALTPSNSGGTIVSCNAAPALPAGLSLSATCVLSGTPTVLAGAADYVITGTNSGGSSNATINIRVLELAPNISYTPDTHAFVLREAIPAVNPTNTGGTITSCSPAPALPAGLSLSATCVIAGTPSVTSGASNYTITAQNTGGTSTATVTIRVKDQPLILFYGKTALGGGFNGVAPLSANIWKATADGQTRSSLTSMPNLSRDSIYPSFSASGSKILYCSKRALDGTVGSPANGSYDIWTATSTGASPTGITANTNNNRDSDDPPVFSPDGTKVVFASKTSLNGLPDGNPASLSYNIWIMDADGTNKAALTGNSNAGLDSRAPVFSPDGMTIYFHSKTALDGSNNGAAANSFNIWKINRDGTGKTKLTNETAAAKDCTEPSISPDGLTLVYVSKSDIGMTPASSANIWKMNVDGTGRTALTINTNAALDSKNPHYSSDGTEIVFASKMNVNAAVANSFNIWKMASTGASQVALTTNNAAALDSDSPNFSPDDARIAFISKMNVLGAPASSTNLWVMNSDGTAQTAITQNTNAGLDSYLSPHSIWFQEQ